MFDCPNCGEPTKKLMICGKAKHKNLTCPECEPCEKDSAYNAQLNQTFVYYKGKEGKRLKLTNGKAWEIRQRISTPDGIINRTTKKRPQY